MNDDLADNDAQEKERIENGEKYLWHEGEGIIFDDNYLHDAANESDEVRVVLWLDMRRPMPFYASIFNKLVLWFVGRDASVEKINKAMIKAAKGELKGILNVTDESNVSIDFNHTTYSSIFAPDQTKVVGGRTVRVLAWYDNEWGFSNRMADTAVAMGKLI